MDSKQNDICHVANRNEMPCHKKLSSSHIYIYIYQFWQTKRIEHAVRLNCDMSVINSKQASIGLLYKCSLGWHWGTEGAGISDSAKEIIRLRPNRLQCLVSVFVQTLS